MIWSNNHWTCKNEVERLMETCVITGISMFVNTSKFYVNVT